MATYTTNALYEIFEEVEKQKSKKKKIETLHKYSSKTLKDFLGYTFDGNIKWLVPEGVPPYEKSQDDANLLRGRIWQDFRLILHFLNIGPYPDMKPIKRENMFISLLSTLHPKDAELLCYVKDNRALPYKSITRELIGEAFPILVAKWKTEEPEKKGVVQEKKDGQDV